eukprot:Amastigsp_a509260_75.p3 type:complete len:153 gc:universal Amastigsp_a509260_75:467-925(+)
MMISFVCQSSTRSFLSSALSWRAWSIPSRDGRATMMSSRFSALLPQYEVIGKKLSTTESRMQYMSMPASPQRTWDAGNETRWSTGDQMYSNAVSRYFASWMVMTVSRSMNMETCSPRNSTPSKRKSRPASTGIAFAIVAGSDERASLTRCIA